MERDVFHFLRINSQRLPGACHFSVLFQADSGENLRKESTCICIFLTLSGYCCFFRISVQLCLTSGVFQRKIRHICHWLFSLWVKFLCVYMFSLGKEQCKSMVRDWGHLKNKNQAYHCWTKCITFWLGRGEKSFFIRRSE